jgi:hypothetical protein
MVNGYNHG